MSKLQKRQPFIKNSVGNATPSSETKVVRYKMRPLRQKLHRLVLAKCTCPPTAILSNKHYSRCSISTRDWAAAWLGAKLVGRWAGWLAGGIPKGVKNATPQLEILYKMRPLRQKKMSQCAFDYLTASIGEHFGVPKIVPHSMK